MVFVVGGCGVVAWGYERKDHIRYDTGVWLDGSGIYAVSEPTSARRALLSMCSRYQRSSLHGGLWRPADGWCAEGYVIPDVGSPSIPERVPLLCVVFASH